MQPAPHGVALSVVIPAYREAARLPRTLTACQSYLLGRGLTHEILVIDDGSPDDTASVAARFEGVTVLRYAQNRGKGFAVRYGMLRAQGERVLFMDADLATPMEELATLEAALDAHPDAGVAFGSRPLRESTLEVRQPLFRELSGRLFNKAVRVFAVGVQPSGLLQGCHGSGRFAHAGLGQRRVQPANGGQRAGFGRYGTADLTGPHRVQIAKLPGRGDALFRTIHAPSWLFWPGRNRRRSQRPRRSGFRSRCAHGR